MEITAIEQRRPVRETPAQKLARESAAFAAGMVRLILLAAIVTPLLLASFLTVDLPIRSFDRLFDAPGLKPGLWLSVGGLIMTATLPLIILITWLIALGDFTHIIAGSVEMAFLMVQGELSLAPAVFRFFLPVLAGNVIGGTAVFTLLTWAQIRPEVEEAKEKRNGRLKT